jgi:hypothetical protein
MGDEAAMFAAHKQDYGIRLEDAVWKSSIVHMNMVKR